MTAEPKKVGLHVIAGVSIAALIIVAVFMSGIQFPSVTARTGTLVILLTDAPVPDLERLEVTISELSVIGEGGVTPLPFDGDTEFHIDNLLALQDVPETLSTARVPVGKYSKIRMTVVSAYAYYGQDDVRNADLIVPSGHIDIIAHFEIEDDAATVITIDMEPDWVAISKHNTLRPVLKVTSITVVQPQPE